ncbi:MAG: hypothetical protein B7X44_06525 [Halothiobacillus sp. 15-55-196]|jgi:hypothetical protein|uniref:hypothetical protein n=1 Tax=Halothiobacillus sp. 15-55-196 TaxID=1970382 RepID=UPI000BC47E14|nr:hypothetical protein [Halothiobacillus sp. 15-55-196]OZB36286.1 MAG: hypothetical protein B7X44_06525 [Halothiobacillus sp. 15-55-196]
MKKYQYQSRLSGWRVYRIDGADYVVGVVFYGEMNIVRVSTAIAEFNRESMTVKTASGTFIKLVGEPRKSILELACLYHISKFAAGSEYEDVSGDYWPGYKDKDESDDIDLSNGPFMDPYE